MAEDQASAAPARPDRAPYSESAIQSTLVTQHTSAGPLRLQSGTFLPLGATEVNLARARAARADGSRIHAILQFDPTPNSASRETLSAMGVRLLGYLPDKAFFAGIPRGISADDLKRAGVEWAGAVYPEDKLPPRIQSSGVGFWALRADGSANLWIRYYPDVSPEDAVRDLAQFEANVVGLDEKLNRITVGALFNQIAAIAARDWVRWIEEVPPPPRTFNDGARADVQADTVQTAPYDLSGAGVVLGIWDGGSVDPTHEDFAGRLVLAETNVGVHFHATHVAGTMAGSGQYSLTAGGTDRQWHGMAPGSSIVSYEFSDPVPKHDEAINVYHVVLSQNSWGVQISEFIGACGLLGEYSHMAPDYDRIITGLYGNPITVAFAAGNQRKQEPGSCNTGPYATIGPPATAKDVITVGAINSDDNSMTTFSSWGPLRDGRLKPELVAPGAEVGNDRGITSTLPGHRYGVLIGTSMATPVVSGAIALLVEDYRGHYNNQDPFPSTMKGLLVHTAADLEDDTTWFHKGPDFASGYGRVQIQDAVEQLRHQGFLIGQVGDRATNTYTLAVPEAAAVLKVTLVWDDPPAMDNAAIALVNDLDLIVLDPDGQRFYPWTLDPANPSLPASKDKEDHLNVIEQVVAGDNPASGNWTIRVVGRNVPVSAPQKYTLLFTPTTIPVPPGIVMEQAVFSDADRDAANHNGFIDPGESISERIVLRNTVGPKATNVTATIQSNSPGIELLQASSGYPNLEAGVAATNATPLAYRVPKTIACGTPITFTCVASANGFLFTNTFSRVVGQFTVTNVVRNDYESAAVPRPIPDGGSVVSGLEITNLGKVASMNVSLRIDHQWDGDVEVELEHPDGTTVRLVPPTGNSGTNFGAGDCDQTGSRTLLSDSATESITAGLPPFVGSFRPDQLLATLDGKRVQGTWSLRVSDIAVQDTGTLLCWGMTITRHEEGYVCSLFNRRPDASDQSVTLLYGVATNVALAGSDPDDDPVFFAVESQPSHGALTDLDAIAGTVTYTPDGGYSGPDAFSYVVSDGYTNSVIATVHFSILPAQANLSLASVSPPVVVFGNDLTVALVVTNAGPNGASGVVLSNALPDGLSLVSAAVSQGSVSDEEGVIRGELGELAAGSAATLTLELRADQLGLWTNAAMVSATEFDPDLTNNTAAVITEVKLDSDLAVSLSATPDPVLVQSLLTYTIDITNQGPHTATAVRLADELPGAGDFVSLQTRQGTGTNDNGTVRCELGELAVGSHALVTIVMQPTALGLLTNRVSVSEGEIDLNPADNLAAAVVTVMPAAELAVSQHTGMEAALLDQPLTLVLTVTNLGPSEATGVRLEDALPPELNFVSVQTSQGGGTNDNGTVRCELGTLAPGSNSTVTVQVVPTVLGLVTNTVIVSATETDLEPTNNTASLVVTVEPAVDLVLTQQATPDPVLLGGQLTYELVVTNAGPSMATAVRLEDVLPPRAKFVLVETSQGSGTNDNGTVRCELGDLASGSNATARIIVEATALGFLTNAATATGSEADPVVTNNTVSVVSQVRLDADLTLSASAAPALALVDQELTYTLVVSNQGPNEATAVTVDDLLPAGVSLVQVQGIPAMLTKPDGIVRVELGTLPRGATGTVTVVIVPHQTNTITNQANVVTDEIDPEPTNNAVQLVATVNPVVDVALIQTNSSGMTVLGAEMTVVLLVTNLGPSGASGVMLSDALPDGLSLVSAAVSQGNVTYEEGVVRGKWAELAAGGTATLTLELRADQLGLWTNAAMVSATEFDPDLTNNTAAVITEVKLDSDLAVSLSATPDPVLVQSLLTYTIDITNQGPHTATAVRLADELPGAGDFVSLQTSQGTGTNDNGTVRCELGELAVGSHALVTIVVQPTALGLLTNRVSVSEEEIDLNPADNLAAAVVTAMPAAELAVSQHTGMEAALLDQPLTLVLTVTNLGPSEATGVRLEDALPPELNFVSVQTSQGGGTNDNGTVRCELGTLAPGSNSTVTVQVVPTVLGLVTNTVIVSATETDLEPTNNTASLVVTVEPAVDLVLTQQATPDPVLLGGQLTYELVVTNAGPSMATAVRLEDVLPPRAKFVLVGTSQGSGTNDNGTVRCELGDLASGSNATARIIVEATALGFLTNAATATGREADPVVTNNTVSVESQVRLSADLQLSASVAPALALALMGQELTYTLAVSNRGPNEATGVRVEDLLPPDVSVVQVHGTAVVTNAGGSVRLELGELDSGAMVEVTLVIVPRQSDTITNLASVTSDAVDPDKDNNAITLVTTVQPWADYVFTQNASLPLALANAPLTFAIRVTSLAPYAVPQTSLTDTLPDSVDFVSATTSHGVCRTESGNLTCDLGVVPGGETATVLLTVVPRALGEITNRVRLASAYADPARSNLTSQLAVMVVNTPTLQFERSQNRLLLWWPLVAQDFVLEVTDNLLPPVNWAQERNTRVVVGDRVTITIKMSTAARYYRLRKP